MHSFICRLVTLKREAGLSTRQTSVPALRVAALLRARTGASRQHSEVVLQQLMACVSLRGMLKSKPSHLPSVNVHSSFESARYIYL